MKNQLLLGATFGIIAGLVSFTAFENSSLLSAAIVFITALWALQRFLTAEKAWKTASFLLNPFFFAIISLLLGFSYFSTEGYSFEISLVFGVGCFFLGGALSISASSYWNIGS